MAEPSQHTKKQLKDLQLKLHEWVDDTDAFVKELRQLASDLDDHFRAISTAKVVGSATSIGGGVLSAVGFGLSFFTFGASLSLTVAGALIAGAGGATVGGSSIADYFISKGKQGSAEEIHQKYRKITENIKEKCLDIGDVLEKYGNVDESFPDWVRFWTGLLFGYGKSAKAVGWDLVVKTLYNSVRVFKGGAQLTESGVQVAKSAFQTLGTVGKVGHVAGGVLGVVFLPLDIYTLVDSSIDVHKDNPHEVSKGIREFASKMENDTPTIQVIDNMIKETMKKVR